MLGKEPVRTLDSALGRSQRAPAQLRYRLEAVPLDVPQRPGNPLVRRDGLQQRVDLRELCAHLGPKLVRDGLYLAGLDVIGGKLIEVNVLNPGGITRINRLNKTRLQAQVVDFVEDVVQRRELPYVRKNELRRLIENQGAG